MVDAKEQGSRADPAQSTGPLSVIDSASSERPTVVALSGGVGGAKLALGLDRIVDPGCLTIVANTGDDFEHLGLSISPDVDTLLYTLSSLADPHKGWGRRDETWNFMATLGMLGGETWFQLGDHDLAMHVERTRRLVAGERLSSIVDDIRRRLGVVSRVLPMTDDRVRTRLRTAGGWLDFQHYFVRLQCEPAVTAIEFTGVEHSAPPPALVEALQQPALRAVVLCPSNPLLSIEPIVAVPGIRAALVACRAPVIAVSPLVRSKSLKGPTSKLLAELGISAPVDAIARRYGDFLSGYVIDSSDANQATDLDVPVAATNTVMQTLNDRMQLARFVLTFADRIGRAASLAMPRERASKP
jgi:LPPG:FO 2-phospho-L-lactate transferase